MLPSAAASLQLSASSSCGAACWPSMRHLHQLQHLRRAVKASGAAHLNLVPYSRRNAVHGRFVKGAAIMPCGNQNLDSSRIAKHKAHLAVALHLAHTAQTQHSVPHLADEPCAAAAAQQEEATPPRV